MIKANYTITLTREDALINSYPIPALLADPTTARSLAFDLFEELKSILPKGVSVNILFSGNSNEYWYIHSSDTKTIHSGNIITSLKNEYKHYCSNNNYLFRTFQNIEQEKINSTTGVDVFKVKHIPGHGNELKKLIKQINKVTSFQ